MKGLMRRWRGCRPGWFRRVVVAGLAGGCLALAGVAGFVLTVDMTPLDRLDDWPVGPVVTDRHGELILARVGTDEQWRSPVSLDAISPWMVQATVAVEDERFDRHWGVDPVALLRAVGQNVKYRRVISGASTITMQLCRMADDRPRTLTAKAIEAARALRLERRMSKQDILTHYLNIAPYGGNIRGVEAAARHYFAKPASELSLPEAALLAGLPQSPARLRPDRHPQAARNRRVTVLRRMVETGRITIAQANDAADHDGVLQRRPVTPGAEHVAGMALRRKPAGGRTTLDLLHQRHVADQLEHHRRRLPSDTDLAVVVIDIPTGDIVAMIGSVNPGDPRHGQVNGATARRSPGSALKPFIYAAAFQQHKLHPDTLIHDAPIHRAGWRPRNFDLQHHGPIPARHALQRSLNVPAILVAEAAGLPYCLGMLEAAGITSPPASPSAARVGLAAVTGGLEVSLLDLTNAYATLGRGGTWMSARLFLDEPQLTRLAIDRTTCRLIDDILGSHARPAVDAMPDVPWFMWKTGTSSGRRDALAVGHNGRFAIGIWAGRLGGAGDAAFVGSEAAEPLLVTLFQHPPFATRLTPTPELPPVSPLTTAPPRLATLTDPRAATPGQPRILTPTPGTRLFTVGRHATLTPETVGVPPASLTWFLNGRLVTPDSQGAFHLLPGRHHLHCTTPTGQAATTTVWVDTANAEPNF